MKHTEVLPKLQDRQKRESKYIAVLKEKAKERERQHEIVFERKLGKERSKEEDLYRDTDKFVTGAYKRKLAQLAKWEEEEESRSRLRDEKDDVTKKSDINDVYLYLQKNVAFGGKDAKTRMLEKQQQAEAAAAAAGAHVEAPLANTQAVEPARAKEAHTGDASTVLKEPEPAAETKPTASAPVQDQAPADAQAADQPKPEHHKRTEDAVTDVKERYLARRRIKEW